MEIFFINNLNRLRSVTNVTQKELASVLNKAQSTLHNWENGSSEPTISEIIKICTYFSIPLHDLLLVDLSQVEEKILKEKFLSKRGLKGYASPLKAAQQAENIEKVKSYLESIMKNLSDTIEDLSSS